MVWIEDQSGELVNLDRVEKIYLEEGLRHDRNSGKVYSSLQITAAIENNEDLCLFHSKEEGVFDRFFVQRKFKEIASILLNAQ